MREKRQDRPGVQLGRAAWGCKLRGVAREEAAVLRALVREACG